MASGGRDAMEKIRMVQGKKWTGRSRNWRRSEGGVRRMPGEKE